MADRAIGGGVNGLRFARALHIGAALCCGAVAFADIYGTQGRALSTVLVAIALGANLVFIADLSDRISANRSDAP